MNPYRPSRHAVGPVSDAADVDDTITAAERRGAAATARGSLTVPTAARAVLAWLADGDETDRPARAEAVLDVERGRARRRRTVIAAAAAILGIPERDEVRRARRG